MDDWWPNALSIIISFYFLETVQIIDSAVVIDGTQ